MARKTPEIPSASMADIAFLLLIFFLVSTTMDVDSGLERRLPPMVEEEQPKDAPAVKERNVFVVLVDANNRLMVEGELMRIADLKEKAKEFMANPRDLETLPEKKLTDVQFFGQVPVTKGVISLQNAVGTQYGTYIAVQNELVAAINELREELAQKQFSKPFSKLNKEQKSAVQDIYPSRISEAEPKRAGGK